MTKRLYYTDAYLREFTATVIDRQGDLVYLDRTALYPASGGQPCDFGQIGGARVVEVLDEGERIAHRVEGATPAGDAVCFVEWNRRFDHMRQHTGQHLLSAVLLELFRAETVSFHLGEDACTIDLAVPSLNRDQVLAAESRVNELICANLPVAVEFQDASEATDLRKASDREGTLRIISIAGYDRSACGGTHVRSTGEIGLVLLRKLEKIRTTTRVEFLCGARALRRARADYDALLAISQSFSAPLDETPALVRVQLDHARSIEKAQRKLAADLAVYQGRELYDQTPPDAGGTRRLVQRQPAGALEELRGVAQSFTAQGKAVYIGVIHASHSVLLATSAESGIDGGKLLKAALTAFGGRGGGAPRMAQGSVNSAEALASLLERLNLEL